MTAGLYASSEAGRVQNLIDNNRLIRIRFAAQPFSQCSVVSTERVIKVILQKGRIAAVHMDAAQWYSR